MTRMMEDMQQDFPVTETQKEETSGNVKRNISVKKGGVKKSMLEFIKGIMSKKLVR